MQISPYKLKKNFMIFYFEWKDVVRSYYILTIFLLLFKYPKKGLKT